MASRVRPRKTKVFNFALLPTTEYQDDSAYADLDIWSHEYSDERLHEEFDINLASLSTIKLHQIARAWMCPELVSDDERKAALKGMKMFVCQRDTDEEVRTHKLSERDEYALNAYMRELKAMVFYIDATESIKKIKNPGKIDSTNATPVEDMAIKLALLARKPAAKRARDDSLYQTPRERRDDEDENDENRDSPSRGGARSAGDASPLGPANDATNARGGGSGVATDRTDAANKEVAIYSQYERKLMPADEIVTQASMRKLRLADKMRNARAALVNFDDPDVFISPRHYWCGCCNRILYNPRLGMNYAWISHMSKHHPGVKDILRADSDGGGLAALEDGDSWPSAARAADGTRGGGILSGRAANFSGLRQYTAAEMRDEYKRTPDAETLVRTYGLPYVGAVYIGNTADSTSDST